jgi:hypothetical protein
MKKLTLKLDAINEMLTKEQMKKIRGGSDPDVCDSECNNSPGDDCSNVHSHCECHPVFPYGTCDASACNCYPNH